MTLDTAHVTDLRSFQNGEERFVWGRHHTTGELWELVDQRAQEDRSYVNRSIICPVPGCPTPKLTTVARSGRRHGLRHHKGNGGHGPESFAHSQGCGLIEAWLKARYPNATVNREEYSNAAGERRADVMMTNTVTKSRVAFEVQYSSISVAEWQRRHDSYQAQGITDIWLFGHTSKQLNFDSDGHLKLTLTHEAVIASGSPLFFLNPFQENADGSAGIIGIAVCEQTPVTYDKDEDRFVTGTPWKTSVCTSNSTDTRLGMMLLSDLRVKSDGLHSDLIDALLRTDARLAAQASYIAGLRRDVQRKEDKRVREVALNWFAERAKLVSDIRSKLRAINSRNLDGYCVHKETGSPLSVRTTWVELTGAAAELDQLIKEYERQARYRFADAYGGSHGLEDSKALFFLTYGAFTQTYWRAVLWFNHIAGSHGERADTRTCHATLKQHGSAESFGDVLRRLGTLERNGYLTPVANTKYPEFSTSLRAFWW